MKQTVIFFFFLAISICAMGQKQTLPIDEQGKYTLFEVVNKPGLNVDSLSLRAKSFFKSSGYKTLKLENLQGDSIYSAKGKFMVTKAVSGIGHPSGDVDYKLVLELRNGKYRYKITDFVYTEYERDRYANFVPGTVKTPLETPPGKLNKSEWENTMNSVTIQAKKLAQSLKTFINNPVNTNTKKQADKKTEKVETDKW
ncbi:hypothetical protein GS399_19015 [Pedobacter sp. HMF7647]|uniref:DUF4468 domain-containing protein n=1 Tax=Hufsiella arboris TaxID=2695275 RepID=A0A7K1YEN5_9SPHI|nr:hypothetical protein [Hufsiella arboris]MXV53066.1 hypothetical protein [Hufsiella arboris]